MLFRSASGVNVIEAEVGETHVVSAMMRHHAALAAEGSNGGIIFPGGKTRDGFLTVLHLMKAAAEEPLARLIAALPPRAYLKEKVACGDP